MKRLSTLGLVTLLAFSAAACSESSEGGGGGAGTAGTAGSSGSAGNDTGGADGGGASGGTSGAAGGGAGGTAGAADGDYTTLAACAQTPACHPVLSSVENVPSLDAPNLKCLLTALRDRTAGAYLFDRNTDDGGGSSTSKDVLLVGTDGKVTHASKHVGSNFNGTQTNWDETTPAVLCALKPASYFQGCLDALESDPTGSAAKECALFYEAWESLPLSYFESCGETAAACEPAQSDFQKLLACATPDVAAAVPTSTSDVAQIASTRSLLEALRDRTAGHYTYATTRDITYYWADQSRVLILDGSTPDSVLTAAEGVDHPENGDFPYAHPAQRCVLKPASYFQTCLDSLDSSSFAFNEPECLHYDLTGYPWFESCADAAAQCE